jgi:hypothetical protein
LLGRVGRAEEEFAVGREDEKAAAFRRDDELGIAVDEFDRRDRREFFDEGSEGT